MTKNYIFRSLGSLFSILTLVACSGCGKSKVDVAVDEHDKKVNECRQELEKKNPLIPIIGGGYLDVSKFAFTVPTVRYEDGRCGTDGFQADFYWTGEKIVPAAEKFTGLAPTQVPKNWRLLRVGAILGNLRRARECEAHPDPDSSRCPKTGSTPGYPATWPRELVVELKHYPQLEIWLEPPPKTFLSEIPFVLKDLRRDDGRPVSVGCFALEGYDLPAMKRSQFEELRFDARPFPCQAEYGDFTFKGGAARVHFSTTALVDIATALKELKVYLSKAIIQEESK
jgi:hypothetical protein